MIKIIPPMRNDAFGAGHYQAPRGSHKHRGIDYAAYPDSIVCAFTAGKVTKLGYPYANDLSYRYVEVTDYKGFKVRYFYIEPCVSVGDIILECDKLGSVQDLDKRYKGITSHFHFEIKTQDGAYLDPNIYLESA